ncbi:beta family protein [Providencia rettgeri]|uniref:beta family protein n=1 Tax=Providencia TaxID=586 RepID=UPI0023495ACE|nr:MULTISPECIES: beta family protein [unclassified Providencia]
MYPTYVPILRAKTGEFDAIKNLKGKYASAICPFFEIPRITEDTKKLKDLRESSQLTKDYLKLIANGISSANSSPSLFFDFFDWKADSYTETGEHILSYMYRALTKKGITVYPVIGFDRWDILDYQKALVGLDVSVETIYCLRIDSVSIDDANDTNYFTEMLDEILNTLGLSPSQVIIMFDFGDVKNKSIVSISNDLRNLLKITKNFNFRNVMLAGCSFPIIINDAVKDTDSTDFVVRKEMHVWKSIYSDLASTIIFSDYGIRNPKGGDGIKAVHANGKIRYTIENKYFVARGHSKQQGNKGAQMYDLARMVVNSPYFLGASFSWGDEQIEKCSNMLIKGNPTQWISFDTNHHISYVIEEVLEFQRNYTGSRKLDKLLVK